MPAVKRVYCQSYPFITRTATSTQTALPEVGKESTLVRIGVDLFSLEHGQQCRLDVRRKQDWVTETQTN